MANTIARYAVSYGQPGYMPDSHGGLIIAKTRRDLVAAFKAELEAYDIPAYKAPKTRELWQMIKRHGSSSMHQHVYHGAYVLSFNGLTEAEAAELEAQQDY